MFEYNTVSRGALNGVVVTVLECHSRGEVFKSRQKFDSRFMLHMYSLTFSTITRTLTHHRSQSVGRSDSDGEDWPPMLIC